jgi:hypothetical protein
MSISAMKQALEALEEPDQCSVEAMWKAKDILRQAIAEAEKQEPVAWFVDGEIKVRLDMAGKLYYSETNVYAAPVHASDISQERVDETAKRKHEWVGLDGDIPGLGLVTEEFYNGMLCAEDILRRRNT